MTKESWKSQTRRFLRAFGRDEDGSIIILTIMLLIMMLVMGGMAVDFMRYESRRAALQSVTDRAVLAATNLDNNQDPSEVVIDYFVKAGFEDAIKGVPNIIDTGNSRTISVASEIDLDTFYLRFVGIEELSAPATSSAIAGVSEIEIALVLDISGSMRNGGSGSDGRFGDMQRAALAFAAQVLDEKYRGQISLNIIPYAGATNPNPYVFDYLDGQRYDGGVSILVDEGDDEIEGTDDDIYFPQVSSCMEIEGSTIDNSDVDLITGTDDWGSSAMPARFRPQVAHFMNWTIAADVMDWGWCPQDTSSIQYAFSEYDDVVPFISNLRMHDGTGTHYAMKWALASLDPDMQPAFAHMNDVSTAAIAAEVAEAVADGDMDAADVAASQRKLVPDSFTDRPAVWEDGGTRKIIVLMTDGRITQQYRPTDPLNYANTQPGGELNSNRSQRTQTTSASDNIERFYAMCNLAKSPERNVEVYTVAFEVTGDGATQMENCATSPAYYYATSGAGLTEAFEEIAQQVTALRLIQ